MGLGQRLEGGEALADEAGVGEHPRGAEAVPGAQEGSGAGGRVGVVGGEQAGGLGVAGAAGEHCDGGVAFGARSLLEQREGVVEEVGASGLERAAQGVEGQLGGEVVGVGAEEVPDLLEHPAGGGGQPGAGELGGDGLVRAAGERGALLGGEQALGAGHGQCCSAASSRTRSR